jgi:hypothetical protein
MARLTSADVQETLPALVPMHELPDCDECHSP